MFRRSIFVLPFAMSLFTLLIQPLTAANASESEEAQRATMIIEDEEARAFRFMIDGKEVARIDAEGLRVRNHVKYGGSITDTEDGNIDEHERNEGNGGSGAR